MGSRRKGDDGLTDQEGLFVENYLAANCNGTEAARRSGYKGDGDTLKVQASVLLTRPNVRRALEEKRKAISMSASEVVQRHSEIARASIEDVCDPVAYPELAYARESGKAHLIRKLTVTTRTIPQKNAVPIIERNVTVELHNAQEAQRTLMKYHGLLTDLIAVKDLPKDQSELVAVLMKEMARVMGPKTDEELVALVMKEMRSATALPPPVPKKVKA